MIHAKKFAHLLIKDICRTSTVCTISSETNLTFTAKRASCISTCGIVMATMSSHSTFIDICEMS